MKRWKELTQTCLTCALCKKLEQTDCVYQSTIVSPKQYLNIWCDSMHEKFNENFAKLDENQDVREEEKNEDGVVL